MSNEIIKEKVKKYFSDACRQLDRIRYAQESAYVDALIGRLDGVLDFGNGLGTISFRPTIFADRGRGAAEHLCGADFSFVFQSYDVDEPIRKAILAQAKNGSIDKLTNAEKNRLSRQCDKMARFTEHYVVLEAPSVAGAMPIIRVGSSGNKSMWKKMNLDDYFLDLVLSCRHGDRRESFITDVGDSKLRSLKIDVRGVIYEPRLSVMGD